MGCYTLSLVASHWTSDHIPLVARGNGLPDLDRAVLELFVLEEQRLWQVVVRVPVKVLAAWRSVQVDDGVDAVPGVLRLSAEIRRGVAHTMSMTRSISLKPSSFITSGSMSSLRCR